MLGALVGWVSADTRAGTKPTRNYELLLVAKPALPHSDRLPRRCRVRWKPAGGPSLSPSMRLGTAAAARLPGHAVADIAERAGQQFLRDITEPVTALIQARIRWVGGDAEPVSAGAVAVATIGVSLHVGIYAIDQGLDLDAAADVGTAYIESAFRSLDISVLAALDSKSGFRAA